MPAFHEPAEIILVGMVRALGRGLEQGPAGAGAQGRKNHGVRDLPAHVVQYVKALDLFVLEALAAQLSASKSKSNLKIEIRDGESVIGGGAAPSSILPTRLLAVSCDGLSADELAARLRLGDPPVIARVEDGRVLLDLRTVFAEQDALILAALDRIAA